ncbi:MAG: copper amine oxidase N-terminal domain-containing protein [Armatimonadota bacterium]
MKCRALVFAVAMVVAAPIVVFAQPAEMPQGIMWQSLLGSTVVYSKSGDLSLTGFERLTAVFLPPAQSNTVYPYNPSDGGKFWAILSTADGTELARYDFWAQERPAPYWVVDDAWVTDLATGERAEGGRVPVEPGQYTLDYFLESGRFYTFAFSVERLDSDDPFQPQTFWFANGPWRDWGALTYADADPNSTLHWTIFLRNRGREASRDVQVELAVTRDSDGAAVCSTRSGMSWSLMREWRNHRFELVGPGGRLFRAGDLLARDGAYTLRMAIDGETYGTWRFEVAGGQLQHSGRAVRGAVDPLEFIEGGPDQWWHIREETGQAPATTPAADGPAEEAVAPAGDTPPAAAVGEAAPPPQIIAGATPVTINGHTMVPLRSVFEWLGAEVKWIPQALTIIANRGDQEIVLMRLDSDEATVNAKKVPLPQRPVQRDGVTYVPLRFSAEAFGATVGFDQVTGAVTITDGDRVGILPQ